MKKNVRKLLQGVGVLPRRGLAVATLDERVRFNGDGLATLHNADFIKEPHFQSAYRAGVSTPHSFGSDLHVEWRVKVALWAAEMGLLREGDFVECGVNSGILSRAIMEYTQFREQSNRRFYLLDTYSGLVEGTVDEKSRLLTNRKYPDIYDQVCEVFAPFPNAVIVRGAIPGTLNQVLSEKIAYLSIDLNCVQPEQDAIATFWPRLSAGAVVVIDDYGFPAHEEQKIAWDEFAAQKQVPLLPLPTGQALIVKT